MDPRRLRAHVETLAAPRHRLHHPARMAVTEALLMESFRIAGWTVERHPFPVAGPAREGVNLLARLGGRKPRAVLVGAHYDTVRDSPGADDNAAAVAVLVELAFHLAGRDLPVVLAAFDMEEEGLLGSRHLAPRLARDLECAVILESVAYVDRRPGSQRLPPGFEVLFPEQTRALWRRKLTGDTLAILHRPDSRRLARDFADHLAGLAGEGVPLVLEDPPVPTPDFARSDHLPFWEAGVPAIMVTDSANYRNPHYHTPTDTPDTLDYDRLADVAAAVAATVLGEVEGS